MRNHMSLYNRVHYYKYFTRFRNPSHLRVHWAALLGPSVGSHDLRYAVLPGLANTNRYMSEHVNTWSPSWWCD